jgi:uncharacterized protein YjlB
VYIVENIKRAAERVTGFAKPARGLMRAAVHSRKPRTRTFKADGTIPNNPVLPFVIYRGAVAVRGASDPAALFESLFETNGWGDSWRNGIYDYVHYHSRIHEVLGIARGRALVRFGGDRATPVEVKAGDVAILPAGTGHHCLKASRDFLVVGAYPPSGTYDECRGSRAEYERALRTIPKVRLPRKDPIYGRSGPLTELWRRRRAAV